MATDCDLTITNSADAHREFVARRHRLILHPFVATETQTCFATPEQWEGTLIDGRHFYFRYRRGSASLGVGSDEDSAVDDPDEVSMRHGDSLQGIFDSAESRAHVFAELLAQRLDSS